MVLVLFVFCFFVFFFVFFFQAEDGIRDTSVTGVQTCALPILVMVIVAMIMIGIIGNRMVVIFMVDTNAITVTSMIIYQNSVLSERM